MITFRRLIFFVYMALSAVAANAETVNLKGLEWLGNLKLTDAELDAVKIAIQKSLEAPIDAEQHCGEHRMDCVVRSAREWTVDGERYREVVIDIHGRGHASQTVAQTGGQWPEITSK